MNAISRAVFTAAAMALATPALSWGEPDFQWYASVGNGAGAEREHAQPPPRPGYIWAPGAWITTTGTKQVLTQGAWIEDDYFRQVRIAADENAKAIVAYQSSNTVPSIPGVTR